MDVVVRLNGGLGNQLFQYSAADYLASLDGKSVFVDTSGFEVLRKRRISAVRNLEIDGFRTNFQLLSADEIGKKSLKYRLAMLEGTSSLGTAIAMILGATEKFAGNSECIVAREGSGWRVDAVAALKGFSCVYLSGYWSSSISHLENRRAALLQQLVPRKEPSERLTNLQKEIAGTKSTVVHVRRGDYITDPQVKGRNVTQRAYFEEAIRLIRENTERFFVFSDDIEWCEQNLQIDSDVKFVSQSADESAADHLYAMSLGTNFVIPNSTFSWWSAWLSRKPDKLVIRPALSMAPGVAHFEDLYPSNWLALNVGGAGGA